MIGFQIVSFEGPGSWISLLPKALTCAQPLQRPYVKGIYPYISLEANWWFGAVSGKKVAWRYDLEVVYNHYLSKIHTCNIPLMRSVELALPTEPTTCHLTCPMTQIAQHIG